MKPTRIAARKCASHLSAGRSAWKAAEDYGIDMALLVANLKRTPLERMRRHDAALNACLALRRGKRLNER
jgi:hypothetical protein